MRKIKSVLTSMLATALILMLAACSSTTTGSSSKSTQNKTVSNLFLMHDKVGNPNYQPYFQKVGADSKSMFGISITPVGYPTTDVFTAAVQAALPTSKAPDLFTWWAQDWATDIAKQGLVADTSSIWEKHKDDFAPSLKTAFTVNGKQYGIPYGVDYYVVYYNKDVFTKNNIQIPKTWSDFTAACDTLKGAGVTPLSQSINGSWPAFLWFEELAARTDPDYYDNLMAGKAKYTDPQGKQVFSLWADMIKKGYFTDPSTDLFNDMPKLFNSDKLGMILCGSWYYKTDMIDAGIPESKIGYFYLPDVNPSAGNVSIMEIAPIQISKNGENTASALKLADYWMSPEGNTFLSKQIGDFPANQKSDTSYLSAIKQDMASTITKGNYRLVTRFWEATPTVLMQKIVEQFGNFIVKPNNMDQIVNTIQSLADDYWAKNK
jgi:multiple sugar transport system substrate-binding protein/raffinose/stachyose/melibiose transport system substrate-binding protein